MITSTCKQCGKEIIKRGYIPAIFCDFNCKAQWQRTQKPATKEWLYQKYIVEGLNCTQISQLVNRNSKRVWEWLRDYGIETRGRGFASSKYQFKKGTNYWKGKKHPQEFKDKIKLLRLKDGHYPKQPNGFPYWKGKKGASTNNWKGGATPERQGLYDKQAWRDLVKRVWERDNAICQRCKTDYRIVNRETVKFAIHHIKSFACSKELRLDINNVVLLCFQCHRFVHSTKNINKEFISE